jgi:TetR/AcrR family transcriptional regulator, transcriptional repressor for nem operon
VSKAERTRMHIVEKTAPLFNMKGFDGTTLADLTAATGLTKGALYGNFENKEEISLYAFRYSVDKVRTMIAQAMKATDTYKKQLEVLLEFFARYVLNPPIPGGCPLLNTAIEADDHHVSMRKVVATELVHTVNFISRLLTKGMEAGEFKRDINPRELAYIFFCSIEGALMFARAEKSEEPMKIVVKHCKGILDQISV